MVETCLSLSVSNFRPFGYYYLQRGDSTLYWLPRIFHGPWIGQKQRIVMHMAIWNKSITHLAMFGAVNLWICWDEAQTQGLLVLTRNLEATDPRDKILGLFSLTDRTETIFLYPDYTKSMSEAFAQITKTLLSRPESLDILISMSTTNININ